MRTPTSPLPRVLSDSECEKYSEKKSTSIALVLHCEPHRDKAQPHATQHGLAQPGSQATTGTTRPGAGSNGAIVALVVCATVHELKPGSASRISAFPAPTTTAQTTSFSKQLTESGCDDRGARSSQRHTSVHTHNTEQRSAGITRDKRLHRTMIN